MRIVISRSAGLPPQSVGSSATRSSIRRRLVSRSTSRTNTPSNNSMNLEKFLEPPQKKVTALSWLTGLYFIYTPNVVLGQPSSRRRASFGIRRYTRFGIVSIRQSPVTMNGLVAAPLQFCADRRFTGAGNASNQIIYPAHGSMIPLRMGCCTWADSSRGFARLGLWPNCDNRDGIGLAGKQPRTQNVDRPYFDETDRCFPTFDVAGQYRPASPTRLG
jgi:hypothetical protein